MALPWLESLTVWGDDARGASRASEAPVRLAVLFSGNGFHSKEWWAKGEGKQMELGKVLAPLDRLPREDALHPRPLQRGGAEGQHPQLADRQSALRRRRSPPAARFVPAPASISCSRRRYGRLDQGAEPGARLREVEPGGPQELLDALQLAHLVELADDAHAAGALSRARLRPPLQGRSAARATRACSTPCWPTPATCADSISTTDQRKLDEYLDSVRDVEQRIEQRRQEGRTAGLAADARQAEHPPPGRRHPAEHRRPHAADVRHPGARLPDRHHAHHHAQAEQRPLVAALPAISASTT